MWASVLAEEAVAAEARDLATPRQLGSRVPGHLPHDSPSCAARGNHPHCKKPPLAHSMTGTPQPGTPHHSTRPESGPSTPPKHCTYDTQQPHRRMHTEQRAQRVTASTKPATQHITTSTTHNTALSDCTLSQAGQHSTHSTCHSICHSTQRLRASAGDGCSDSDTSLCGVLESSLCLCRCWCPR